MRGTTSRAFVAVAVAVAMAAALGARPASGGDGEVRGTLRGRVLATGGRRIFIFDKTGKTVWQHKGGNCSDCWVLPSGNVLFADGEVKEVTPEGKVAFRFSPKEKKGGGAFTCQRLEDGRTLIGENSTGRILEVDRDGKIVFELKTEPYKKGNHHNLRMVRKLPNGNYLVCHSGARTVREYTPRGDVVQEIKVGAVAFAAVRLASGNTMVGYLDSISEFDPGGRKVWEFTNKDIPGQRIGKMCGIHVLPNGNVVVGVYAAYDKEGRGLGAFEITREKKIVWAYRSPKRDRSMMSVQLLDWRGKPLRGPAIR